jgi:hypothetical protein
MLAVSFAAGSVSGDKVRVDCPRQDLARVARYVDEFYEVSDDYFVGAVSDKSLRKIERLGYRVEPVVKETPPSDPPTLAHYHTYTQIMDTFTIMVQNNPGICCLETLGMSVGGKYIVALKISDNPTIDEPEPRAMWDGAIHGNEPIAAEVVFYLALQLISQYGTSPDITYLVDNRETWLIPLVNPDGFARSPRSRYNNNRQDLNRCYGYVWQYQSSARNPWGEPEVRALWSFAQRHVMDHWVQYHSGTESVMWPWGFSRIAPIDSVYHSFLANRYDDYVHYGAFQIARGLYPASGSSVDYYYGAEGALGLGIEVSHVKEPPPDDIEDICIENYYANLDLLAEIAHGVDGFVVDSATGDPICNALVRMMPPDWPVYTDQSGYYHRYAQAQTCSLLVTANGYKPKVLRGVTVLADTNVWLDTFRLVPDSAEPRCAEKVVLCRIGGTSSPYTDAYTAYGLGPADGIRYHMGKKGWAYFDMGEHGLITDGDGDDFRIVEGDADVEACSVFVGNVCDPVPSGFQYLGMTNGTTSFDLDDVALDSARYVRLADDNDGSAGPTAGFDLDAIETTHDVGIEDRPLARFPRDPLRIQTPGLFSGRLAFTLISPATGRVTADVVAADGRVVHSFAAELDRPGRQDFTWNATNAAAGVYFIHARAGSLYHSAKVLLAE